jgi:hypothetical protein
MHVRLSDRYLVPLINSPKQSDWHLQDHIYLQLGLSKKKTTSKHLLTNSFNLMCLTAGYQCCGLFVANSCLYAFQINVFTPPQPYTDCLSCQNLATLDYFCPVTGQLDWQDDKRKMLKQCAMKAS